VVGAETVTVATGATVTVIEDAPLCPSLVAVIVTGPPAATAVTRPVVLTVARALLLDVQVTTRPVRTLPFESFVTALNCRVGVMPSTRVAVAGLTVTVATEAGLTVSVALPVLVSLVAMIWTEPGATLVTSPVADTVAAAGLPELHVTLRPVRMLPAASRVIAVDWVVCPAVIDVEARDTVTSATGTGTTVIADVPF
jgi:hypothetical protein